jgi:hypothetical protein
MGDIVNRDVNDDNYVRPENSPDSGYMEISFIDNNNNLTFEKDIDTFLEGEYQDSTATYVEVRNHNGSLREKYEYAMNSGDSGTIDRFLSHAESDNVLQMFDRNF